MMVKEQIMQKTYIGVLLVGCCLLPVLFQSNRIEKSEKKLRVGLCVMATGTYIQYIERLLDSADQYFLPDHEVTYFVFTDSPFAHAHTKMIYQEQIGWPYDSILIKISLIDF